jgi:hypothetical protein
MKPLCQKPAGRVERSAAATDVAPEAIDMAVVAQWVPWPSKTLFGVSNSL